METLDISLKDNILNKEEGKRLSTACGPIYDILRNQEEQMKKQPVALKRGWPG